MSDVPRETTFELTEKGLVATLITRESEVFSRVKVDLSELDIFDITCHRGAEAIRDRFEVNGRDLIDANEFHSFYPRNLRDEVGNVLAAIKGRKYLLVSRETYDVGELSEAEVKPFDHEYYGVTSVEGNRVRFVSLKEGKIE